MIPKSSLDFAEAARVADAARQAAQARGASIAIAVVDDAGHLLAFNRMDGARAFTADLAIRKARVAASIGVATKLVTDMLRNTPGAALDAAVGSGGQPALAGALCVGAIGISGAMPDIDDAIAAAGLAALG